MTLAGQTSKGISRRSGEEERALGDVEEVPRVGEAHVLVGAGQALEERANITQLDVLGGFVESYSVNLVSACLGLSRTSEGTNRSRGAKRT